MEKERLYIPYGIGIEKEYIIGFGKKEVKHFFVGLLCTALLAVLAYLIGQNVAVPAVIVMAGAGGSYMTTRKETYSQSVVEIVQTIIRYRKSQQKFLYKY